MGTGYTRNDTANNIADGNIINASDLDGEFDAIESAFNGSTGHSHDGSTGEGPIINVFGDSTDSISISSAALIPNADDTIDLGSSSAQFKDLHLDGTANIDSLVADTADINGGTLDGTTIGGTTPAAGTFTTGDFNTSLNVDGTITSDGLTVDGTATIGNATYGSSLGQFRIINDASSAPASLSLFGHNDVSDGTDFAKIEFAMQTAGTGGNVVSQITSEAEGTSENAAHLTFETASGGSLSEVMRLTSGGSVGIGESNPAYKLDVASAVIQFGDSTDAFAQYKSSAGNWHVGANSSNAFAFYSGTYGSGSERMRLSSAGKLSLTQSDEGMQIGPDVAAYTIKRDSGGLLNFNATQATFNGYIFDTVDGERMRIDSSGNLLVSTDSDFASGTVDGIIAQGTAKPAAAFSNTADGQLVKFYKGGSLVGSIGTVDGDIYVGTGDTGLFFSDANNQIRPYNTTTQNSVDNAIDIGRSASRFKDLYLGGNAQFGSSGAGTVVSQTSGGGHVLQSTSYAAFSRESGAADQAVIILNDTGSGGKVIAIRKDGSDVGAIGTASGYPFIAAPSNFSLMLVTSDFRPRTVNGDSNYDNAIDVGTSSTRFDDVYATNGTIQTSDRNEKQQIASLTDAEITAAKAISKLFKTFKWNDSVEEKGDAARTHAGIIAQDVQQAMTDAGLDAGDYAFFISATWWETQTEVPAVEAVEAQDAVYDDDGNLVSEAVEAVEAQEAYTRIESYDTAEEAPEGATERTRLGIRYPELLAFIGAATEQRLANIETRLTALETL